MNERLETALAHWGYVAPLLTPPANEKEYQVLVEAMDAIMDARSHRCERARALASLAAMVGELMSEYEASRHPCRRQ